MNYWLLCLPKEDLQHCIKIETYGLSRRQVIDRVKQDDLIICCAGKGDWKIIAQGIATSDHFVDIEPIFLKQELFPDRFHFKATLLEAEIDLMSIIKKLTFVTNPAYWAVYFRNGIARMQKQDYELILNTRISMFDNHTGGHKNQQMRSNEV